MLIASDKEIRPVQSTWVYYRSRTSKLLYFSHYKCASTLYRGWFEKIGWEKVHLSLSEIDWDNFYVFSYIRDPIIKHRKAIVEFFCVQKIDDIINVALKNDSRWLDILASITAIDGHSRTIRSILGEQAPLKIDWIPIDIEFDHKQYTLDILEANGEIIDDKFKQELINSNKINESTEEEEKLFDQLIKIPPSWMILDYIDYDQCIYNSIVHSVLER